MEESKESGPSRIGEIFDIESIFSIEKPGSGENKVIEKAEKGGYEYIHKDKVIAEYALSDIKKPIGVSEYKLTQSLPKRLKSSLPTIKEIEAELSGM